MPEGKWFFSFVGCNITLGLVQCSPCRETTLLLPFWWEFIEGQLILLFIEVIISWRASCKVTVEWVSSWLTTQDSYHFCSLRFKKYYLFVYVCVCESDVGRISQTTWLGSMTSENGKSRKKCKVWILSWKKSKFGKPPYIWMNGVITLLKCQGVKNVMKGLNPPQPFVTQHCGPSPALTGLGVSGDEQVDGRVMGERKVSNRWWRDWRWREDKWFVCYKESLNRRHQGREEYPNVSSLHCHVSLCVNPGPYCHWAPHLGLWLYRSTDLCPCP